MWQSRQLTQCARNSDDTSFYKTHKFFVSLTIKFIILTFSFLKIEFEFVVLFSDEWKHIYLYPNLWMVKCRDHFTLPVSFTDKIKYQTIKDFFSLSIIFEDNRMWVILAEWKHEIGTQNKHKCHQYFVLSVSFVFHLDCLHVSRKIVRYKKLWKWK